MGLCVRVFSVCLSLALVARQSGRERKGDEDAGY